MSAKANFKHGKIVHAMIALCLIATIMTSCSGGGLDGTYQSTKNGESVTFSSGNKITIPISGIEITGTYKIDGDRMTVTYEALGSSSTWRCKFKQNGNTVFIDDTQFNKK